MKEGTIHLTYLFFCRRRCKRPITTQSSKWNISCIPLYYDDFSSSARFFFFSDAWRNSDNSIPFLFHDVKEFFFNNYYCDFFLFLDISLSDRSTYYSLHIIRFYNIIYIYIYIFMYIVV